MCIVSRLLCQPDFWQTENLNLRVAISLLANTYCQLSSASCCASLCVILKPWEKSKEYSLCKVCTNK